MASITIEDEAESERLLIERAAALIVQLRRTVLEAPLGTVLAACEDQAVRPERRLTPAVLEDAIRRRVAEVGSPKNGRPVGAARGDGSVSC